MDKSPQDLFNKIKLVVFDFDGVFTDNFVYVDESGSEMVRFFRSDGIGLSRLREMVIQCLVLSTEINPVVSLRCKKLGVECYQGLSNKLDLLTRLAKERNIGPHETAYVGNDVNDLECLQWVGLAIAVPDAYPEVLSIAQVITTRKGGHGAVREVCDLIYSAHQSQLTSQII